jgi:signal peptidase
MNEKSRKALSVLSDIGVFIIIIFAIAVTVMAFSSRESGVPKLFGYSFLSVQSDSMSGTFEVGDLIVVENCNPETLKEGDVVTYWKYTKEGKFLNTHRIVEKIETRFDIYNETVTTYRTKGDHNEEVDADTLATRDIFGKWTNKKVRHLGTVMDFLSSQKGFMICIVVPLALLFVYQLYKFITTLIESRKDKVLEEIASKTEEEKNRVIAEYLAEQERLRNENQQPQTVPAQTVPEQIKTGQEEDSSPEQ